MQGLVFKGNRQVGLDQFPDPGRVRAMSSSRCAPRDLRQRPESVPQAALSLTAAVVCGHEPCGVVARARPGRRRAAGADWANAVMIHHYRGCGHVLAVRHGLHPDVRAGRGHGHRYPRRHAPYLLAPASDAGASCRTSLSFAEGAAIACGTGTAYAALKRLDVSGRDTLAIFGQGPVGPGGDAARRRHGRARARHRPVSRAARDGRCSLGAEAALDPSTVDPVDEIRALTHGEGADATLDCSGHPEARANCARAARAVGPGVLRRRARHRDLRHDPRRHPPPADDVRLLDLQRAADGGVRPLRGRPQGPAWAASSPTRSPSTRPTTPTGAWKRRRWAKASSCSSPS